MGIPATLSKVPATTPYIQYVASSGQTVFPYPFPITQDQDLVVVVAGVTLPTDTGYTVSGVGNDTGGNVTFTSGLLAGQIVTLYRDIQIERLTQIGQNSGFASTAFNAEYNNIYLIMQQLADSIGFCLQLPNTNNPAPTTSLTPATYANKYLAFDANGNPVPAVLTSSGSLTGAIIIALLTQAQIASVFQPQTPAESAVGVVPTVLQWPQGDPRRYGAVLDGVADDTVALTNWAKVGGNLTFPSYTAFITATIPLYSNTTITGCQGAIVSTATHDISLFSAVSKTHVSVRGIHFLQTSIGAVASIGGVYLTDCSYCFIENNEFEGMQYSGIWAQAISYCTIRGNRIHDPLGTAQDSCDIYVASSPSTTSKHNIIDGNFCYGTTFEFGIAVWDPYSGVLPLHNVITNNRVGAHNGYGILLYMPDAGDTYTQVIGNHVHDISAHSTNTDSGAGIYMVGAGVGGTVIIGNTIRNCCITTTTTSLAPAGIGLSTTSAGTVPVVIQGNVIEGMTKYWGILAVGALGGVTISGNTIRLPASNTTGDCIKIANSNNVSCTGNILTNLNTTSNQLGIAVWAQGASNTNITVANNTVTGGYQGQIRTIQTGGNLNTGLVISGNHLNGGGANCTPLVFDSASAANVLVSSNNIRANTMPCITQTACTSVRYMGNLVVSTGTTILNFVGINTGSYYDKTNVGSGAGTFVSNAGTLLIIEQLAAAAPGAGTWAVGDRVEQSVPVVTNPKGWRCTVAGSPGTWVSEGNL